MLDKMIDHINNLLLRRRILENRLTKLDVERASIISSLKELDDNIAQLMLAYKKQVFS